MTPVGVEQRVEALDGVASAACVGVGPEGGQVVVVVVVPTGAARTGDGFSLAGADAAAQVRDTAGVPVAAVLVTGDLPVDIRHNSKIDRARLSRRVSDFLS